MWRPSAAASAGWSLMPAPTSSGRRGQRRDAARRMPKSSRGDEVGQAPEPRGRPAARARGGVARPAAGLGHAVATADVAGEAVQARIGRRAGAGHTGCAGRPAPTQGSSGELALRALPDESTAARCGCGRGRPAAASTSSMSGVSSPSAAAAGATSASAPPWITRVASSAWREPVRECLAGAPVRPGRASQARRRTRAGRSCDGGGGTASATG